MSALPLPRETLPGLVHGIVAVTGDLITIQCDRCYETHTDWPIFAVGWAPFPAEHQVYDHNKWVSGERLCPECRAACGCTGCRRVGR